MAGASPPPPCGRPDSAATKPTGIRIFLRGSGVDKARDKACDKVRESESTMTEGISVTGLTIGGAALTAVGGIAGAWIKARFGATRIHPQPLEVSAKERYTSREECAKTHRAVDSCTANLFSRMSCAEQRIAAVEASQKAVEGQLSRMDNKLDVLLGRRPS